MKKIIKKVLILSIIVITILCGNIFASCCSLEVHRFEDVKQEFSQYEADLNTAVLYGFTNLFFYDRTIRLEEMVPEEEISNFQIINNNIYFTAKEFTGRRTARFVLYRCDLNGNNLVWLFKKEKVIRVRDTFNGDTLYIQQYNSSLEKIIESYNLLTGEFANVARGEDCDINNYKVAKTKKYTCEYKNKNDKNSLTIIDNETLEAFAYDEDYLKQTQYYKSFSKYPYRLGVVNEYKGKLYITYILDIVEDTSELFPDCLVVVFEFDFKNKELIYKTIVQIDDIENYCAINTEG